MKVKENNSMFYSCAQVSHIRITSKSLNAAHIFILCLVAKKQLKDMERKKLLTVSLTSLMRLIYLFEILSSKLFFWLLS